MVESLVVIVFEFDDDEVRLHSKAVVYIHHGESLRSKLIRHESMRQQREPSAVMKCRGIILCSEKAESMDTSQTEVTMVNIARKRKDGWRDELEVPFKLLRCHPHEYCKFFAEGMSGGIIVNDLRSDENALAMEH